MSLEIKTSPKNGALKKNKDMELQSEDCMGHSGALNY